MSKFRFVLLMCYVTLCLIFAGRATWQYGWIGGMFTVGVLVLFALLLSITFIDSYGPTYADKVACRARALGYTSDEAEVLAKSGLRECWRIDEAFRALQRSKASEIHLAKATRELQSLEREVSPSVTARKTYSASHWSSQ